MDSAYALFSESLEQRPSVHAARNLAVFAPDTTTALAYYQQVCAVEWVLMAQHHESDWMTLAYRINMLNMSMPGLDHMATHGPKARPEHYAAGQRPGQVAK